MASRPFGLPRRIPAWAWLALKVPGRHLPHKKPAWFWTWRSWRLHLRKPRHRLVRVPMFDDVTAYKIPADAVAAAVYVDGRYANEAAVRRHAPHAKILTIAVFPHDDADCLDIENGDATPAQAPVWVARQIKRGVKRPVVYSSVSEMPAVIHELERAGIKREAVLLWTAHYTFKRHICSKKCNPFFVWTADGTQWTDRSHGESLDESWVSDAFFA